MLTIFLAAALTLSQPAGTNKTLYSLDDCFKMSVRRSYTLADQTELLKQAELHYTQAWENFYPVLSASGAQQTGGYFSQGSSQTNMLSLKLTLSQPLFRGFRSLAVLDQSGALIQAQKEARQWALYQLYLDTAQAFYSVLSLQKDIIHISNQLQIYDRRVQQIDAWVRIGKSRQSDLSSVKAARALALSQEIQLRGQLSNACELFEFITGITNGYQLSDSPEFNDNIPPIDEFMQTMLSRPDLIAARQKKFSAIKAIDIANSERLPWADLSLSSGNSQFYQSNPVSWNIQLTLTYSIFADTVIQSKIDEARSVYKQSENAFEFLSDTIRRDIRISYANLVSGREQITATKDAIRFLEDNAKQLERDYRLGAAKITDLLNASSSYEDSVLTLDHLLYSAKFEWLRINVYSGKFILPAGVN